MTNSQTEIEDIVKDLVKESGLELIDFKIFPSGQKIIRASVDYPEGGVTVSDCATLNKRIVAGLIDQGISADDYSIEISSPGLDRPLKEYRDFLRVKDKILLLWLNEPIAGRSYLEAELRDLNRDKLFLVYKGEFLEIELCNIKIGKEKIRCKKNF